jgi:hypothetical protein
VRGTYGGAGASAWARYRVLAAEHRPERVILRVALAVTAGVFVAGPVDVLFGGTAGWYAGAGTAVAVLALHAWYLRRRPGVVSGWRTGALAERRTGRALATLDPACFHVLHDRVLPDAPAANLDHLVIGLTGVYAVTTRHWGRFTTDRRHGGVVGLLRRLGRPLRLRADRRRVWLGDRPILDLPAAAGRAGRTVAAALAAELDHDIRVTPIVAVHGASPPRGGLRFGGVVFQPARRVPRFVRERPIVFTSAQVATITAAAERLLPPMLGRTWQ